MKAIHAYLTFPGNCREAMTFYEKALGGELSLMTFADAQQDVAKDELNRIMHARLTKGGAMLMASDTAHGMKVQGGNNFSISLGCDDAKEAEKVFKALSEKGKVTMPLAETFFAVRFGMLTDQFGIQWMINVDKAMQR